MWGDDNTGGTAGGFMDESYSTGGQSTQKDTQENAVRNTLVLPIMIGDLLNHTPDTLKYRDTKVRIVRLVAVVKSISEVTTKIAYQLEDETGTITAYRWLESDDKLSNEATNVEINKYAVIHGYLREGGEEAKHVFIVKIRPVTSYAVVFSHLLEITRLVYKLENDVSSPTSKVATASFAENAGDNGLTPDQRTIFQLIKAMDEADDIGIERSELKAKVPSKLVSKVDEILDFLVCEGHIYTTRTDDHFKAT